MRHTICPSTRHFTLSAIPKHRFVRPRFSTQFEGCHIGIYYRRSIHSGSARRESWSIFDRLSAFFAQTSQDRTMEVTRANFQQELPSILHHISKAQFVAVDLELSGIPNQQKRTLRGRRTLQERYADVKVAAEKYSILQVGLTCVEEDDENDRYLTRSFNCNLSPIMISNAVDIDRDFTYSAGAVAFLLRHNYRMDAPFIHGIPYLMYDEVNVMRERLEEKLNNSTNIPDIPLEGNAEAQEFTQKVKTEIDTWLVTQKPQKHIHHIEPIKMTGRATLASFERRLIYQLIRASYPSLVATGNKLGYMEISNKNVDVEKARRENMQQRNNTIFSDQFGFSWIPQALRGANLSDLDLDITNANEIVVGVPYDPNASQKRFDDTKNVLDGRRSVLVGHNCFMDLVFIYRYFYGPLPDSVEDFTAAIHDIFPLIIDTKYMVTAHADSANARDSQLWEINESLAKDKKSSIMIEAASDQPNYNDTEHYHEAGYDSYATALSFLRLASKLGISRGYIEPSSASTTTHSNNDSADAPPRPAKRNPRKKADGKPAEEMSKGKFFHQNIFDNLMQDSEAGPPTKSESAETPVSSSNAIKPDVNGSSRTSVVLPASDATSRKIPPWDNKFWDDYGNKLRVYGTQEEVCNLKVVRGEAGVAENVILEGEQKEEEAGQGTSNGRASLLEMTGIKKMLQSLS